MQQRVLTMLLTTGETNDLMGAESGSSGLDSLAGDSCRSATDINPEFRSARG